MLIVLAVLLALAMILIAVTHELDQRRFRSTLNMERARQDQLMNRLAARNLTEYTAVEVAQSVAVTPDKPAEPRRYLYDESGLTRIEAPVELDDPAYEAAGTM